MIWGQPPPDERRTLKRPCLWHVTCGHVFENTLMAAKIRMLKLLQEIRCYAEFTNRHPQPRTPGLFLTQLRASAVRATLPRRKLSVAMDTQTLAGIPHQVKINHVKQGAAPAPRLSAP